MLASLLMPLFEHAFAASIVNRTRSATMVPEIAAEVTRTLEEKLGLTKVQTQHLIDELMTHFGDAWVKDYEPLIPAMNNHPKDRHVLAAAVRTGAQTIVTFNLKDFPEEALTPGMFRLKVPTSS